MDSLARGSTSGEPRVIEGMAPRAKRADAVRNIAHLVAAARTAFAASGPNASLDEIARSAGVGPGTLYRHFPTRHALLEAVYREVVDELCAEGERLLVTLPPDEAFAAWLHRFVSYVGEKKGLAGALSSEAPEERMVFSQCRANVFATGAKLLEAAKASGAIDPALELGDVFKLVTAIARAGEGSADGADTSGRLLDLAIRGLYAEGRQQAG
jgi:AcrR family transcriptional regulator